MEREKRREVAKKYLNDEDMIDLDYKKAVICTESAVKKDGWPIYDKNVECFSNRITKQKEEHIRKNYSEEERVWLKLNMNY